MSADGSVVVGTSVSTSGDEAFIWDSTNGMRSLTSVLQNDYGMNLTRWTLSGAQGISADGQTIVGYGKNPAGNNEAWMANIPEPSTFVLLAIGAVGFLAWAWRRRKRA